MRANLRLYKRSLRIARLNNAKCACARTRIEWNSPHAVQARPQPPGAVIFLMGVPVATLFVETFYYSRRPAGLLLLTEGFFSWPAKPPGFSCAVCTVRSEVSEEKSSV